MQETRKQEKNLVHNRGGATAQALRWPRLGHHKKLAMKAHLLWTCALLRNWNLYTQNSLEHHW